MPFVSVIIATRNRCALLGETLDALASQQWPADRMEVVVADNGSTDGTASTVHGAAARHHGVDFRYLRVDRPGKSFAVNAALAVARGDVLAFTDDDVKPASTWLANLMAAFEDSSVDFVAGRIHPIWECAPPSWLTPALHGVLAIPDNGPEPLAITLGGNEQVMPIGANMAVRREVVDRIGGLREDLGKVEGSLRTGEDHEFFLRMLHAGFRGTYDPRVSVGHLVPAARLRRSYFRRWLFQNGRDVACLHRSFPNPAAHLAGVPRYLWRQAASDAVGTAGAMLRGDAGTRFAHWTRLVWFGGYVLEAWTGPVAIRAARTPLQAER